MRRSSFMFALIAVPLMVTAIVAATASAPPQTCAAETFTIDDQPVAVRICAPLAISVGSDGRARVPLTETFSGRGGNVSKTASLDYQENAGELSRMIDDASLDALGISHSLHLTIGFKPGTVRLEHALLTPGARPLK